MGLKIKLSIKDLPLASRPRERLVSNGRSNLSDIELLAILLGTGTTKQDALQLSQKIVTKFPLQHMGGISVSDLVKIPGVGKSKASRIMAALELGERIYAPQHLTKIIVRSTADAVGQLKEFAGKKQEYLVAIYLNARHELLQKEVIGIGSLNAMVITPKEIFSPALMTPCASVIVSHNHPSGDPNPSEDDIKFTQRVHEAGEVLGIPLIDHIVTARTGYFSFRDNKTAHL